MLSNGTERGSKIREMMMRSMEKPAGEWKPTNIRKKSLLDVLELLSLCIGLIVAALLWLAFNGVLSWFR